LLLHALDLVGLDRVVEADGAGQIPAVHDEIRAQEPARGRFERRAAHEAVELGGSTFRVVELRLHRVAGGVPRAGRIVCRRWAVGDLLTDEAEEHALRVHDVIDDVLSSPLCTRRLPRPCVVGHRRDLVGERLAQAAIPISDCTHRASSSRERMLTRRPNVEFGRPAVLDGVEQYRYVADTSPLPLLEDGRLAVGNAW
jgi:hypothetical protein